MSRVGKNPVQIPQGVQVSLKDGKIVVKGKRGELSLPVSEHIETVIEDNRLLLSQKMMVLPQEQCGALPEH